MRFGNGMNPISRFVKSGTTLNVETQGENSMALRYLPRSRAPKFKHSLSAIKKLNDAIERDAIRWNCSKNWIMVTALGAFYGIEVINPFKLEKDQIEKEKGIREKNTKILQMRKRA